MATKTEKWIGLVPNIILGASFITFVGVSIGAIEQKKEQVRQENAYMETLKADPTLNMLRKEGYVIKPYDVTQRAVTEITDECRNKGLSTKLQVFPFNGRVITAIRCEQNVLDYKK